jgi:hypothetical protein
MRHTPSPPPGAASSSSPTASPRPRGAHRAPERARHTRRRFLTVVAALAMLVALATSALAATRVTVTNAGGLVDVGPVNAAHGFPSWYEDSAGTRLEPCLDMDNPLCGLLPDEVPDPDAPISYPGNFPGEFFYQLAGAELDLPGSGRAVLTLGLEAAWANDVVRNGDQVTFSRTRVVVRGAPADTTLTFQHPFGELTIDTDATGAGRLVEDISPSVGNFRTALKGNFGPFLRWDTGAPAGYAGNPDVAHAVTGSPTGFNQFAVTGGGLNLSTSQFTVTGKLATNTGVTGDHAVLNDGFLDVFASSRGSQLQVKAADGIPATPMTHDEGSQRHYARIALPQGTTPTAVTVQNLGDDPVSESVIRLSGIRVSRAEYSGSQLVVFAAVTAPASYPLTVEGLGTITSEGTATFDVTAPPAVVTVSSGDSRTTFPVTVTGGPVTPGLPPIESGPDTPPVTDNSPDNPDAQPAGPVATATAAAPSVLRGGTTTLDGGGSTAATSYAWSQLSGPPVTLSSLTVAKPTLTVPYAVPPTGTPTAPAPASAAGDAVLQLTVTGAGGATSTARVTVTVVQDALAVTTARHKPGQELRIGGTSLIAGWPATLNQPTQVYVWNLANPATPVLLGKAPVDTLGNWELRQKPGPAAQLSSVGVQSTRGGAVTPMPVTR